ncbi:MAG: nucleotidyltransferase domain-containing protein [bacterium]
MGKGLWLLKKIKEEKRAGREESRRALLQDAKEKLTHYFQDKNAREVYLFGSITREEGFYDWSDVDIAISLPDGDYFRMISEIEGLLGRDIHLVLLEGCGFEERIRKEGIKIL